MALDLDRKAAAAAEESAERAEADAKEAKQQSAKAKAFVEEHDAKARVIQQAVSALRDDEQRIRRESGVSSAVSASLRDIRSAMDIYWEVLEDTPKKINNAADGIQEAIRSFQQASDSLLVAEGSAASGALDRFSQITEAATKKYNDNLRKMYLDTGISPPLI